VIAVAAHEEALPKMTRAGYIMSVNYAHNAKVLKNLRQWANDNLPIYGSYIGYDLAVQILESSGSGKQTALKEIYHSLPYSEPQLRRRLRQFQRDGWISVENNREDKRNFFVLPTEKMLLSYGEYFRLMTSLCHEMRPSS
jgi:hypothetical protein